MVVCNSMATVRQHTRIDFPTKKTSLARPRLTVAVRRCRWGFASNPRKRFTVSGAEVLRPNLDGSDRTRWLCMATAIVWGQVWKNPPTEDPTRPGERPGVFAIIPAMSAGLSWAQAESWRIRLGPLLTTPCSLLPLKVVNSRGYIGSRSLGSLSPSVHPGREPAYERNVGCHNGLM